MIFTEDDLKAAVKCAREVTEDSFYTPFLLSDEEFYIKVLEHARAKACTALAKLTEDVGGYDKEFKPDDPR